MDSYIVAYDICDPKRLRRVARAFPSSLNEFRRVGGLKNRGES